VIRLITHNFGWKLLSLAAACLVWLSIASEPDLATIVSAPVQYKNYPRDLEISSAIVDNIDIDARGPARQLRDLSSARIAVVIDFSTVKAAGERTFTLTPKEVTLPYGVELVRTIPAQLRFTFEGRATRALHIDVPTSGRLRDGLSIVRMEVSPPTLTITGPASRVAAAKNAITDPFDLTPVKGDMEEHLSVFVAEPEVRFTGNPRVTVKIRVQRTH